MLRIHSYLLGVSLLAVAFAVLLMVVGTLPAPRSSVLGATLAGGEGSKSSETVPTIVFIAAPISFDGLRPGQTGAFGLREGLVVLHAQYDGTVEPFSVGLQSLDDPQADPIAPISIIPPLDRKGSASGKIFKAGRYVLIVERAEGEWSVTISQPGGWRGAL